MSEQINNREYRKQVIRQVIRDLHAGRSVEEVKTVFEKAFHGVSASEITEAEQELISEGLPVSEVQRLCDVHSAAFHGSIEDIHSEDQSFLAPGHPVALLKEENRWLVNWIERQIDPYIGDPEQEEKLQQGLLGLERIDVHYAKKENLFFPYMEKNGITGPPQVMWGVDDEIRAEIRTLTDTFGKDGMEPVERNRRTRLLVGKVQEMIFKEENILIPMLADVLTEKDWKAIADGSREIGFVVEDVPEWLPEEVPDGTAGDEDEPQVMGQINLPSGVFTVPELTAMFNTLPFDITFVGKDDTVKYFTEGRDRIFTRTRSIIGRNVANCHPPASVHIVQGIVADFRSGKKDQEDFWIRMGERFVLIRYYAVRDPEGAYLGVLEVTQDIHPLQDLTGEKRLVSAE